MKDESQTGASNPGAELIGKVLAGRYRILELLGQGAMGSVYVGEHLKIGRRDAIKVLRKSIADDDDAIARFMRGAQHASKVRHPNVCSIYDFAESEDGTAFLAMELIEGETLQECLAREHALPLAECVQIVKQAADGLQAAHDEGIVHRDLKPGNIMLTRDRSGAFIVKVVDFDIAKGSSDDEPAELTQLGLVIGTPEYMSPEQLTADRLDGRSDVYSLGIVLFRMLTGVPPFSASSTREMMVQRLTKVPYTLAEAAPGQPFPAAVQQVLDRALERNPDDRYADAEAFAAAIEEAAGQAVEQLSVGSPAHPQEGAAGPSLPGTEISAIDQPEMKWRRTKRRKYPVPYLIPGAVVLIAAVTALTVWMERSPSVSDQGSPADDPVVAAAVSDEADQAGQDGETVGTPQGNQVASQGEAGGAAEPPPGNPSARPGSEGSAAGEVAPPAGGLPATGGGSSGDSVPPAVTRFTLESDQLTFQSREGGAPPDVHSLRIQGPVGGIMESRVAYRLGEPSGWVQVELSADRPPATMSVTVDPTMVPVGRHEARVNLSDGSAYLGAVRVTLDKVDRDAPAQNSEAEDSTAGQATPPPGDTAALLNRQVDALLDGADPAAVAAARDTAQSVWSGQGSPVFRAQAAFVMAESELIAGDAAAALVWADLAVELAPENEEYVRLLERLRGGAS